MNIEKNPRKTVPMQVRMKPPFKAQVDEVAKQLQISSCALVRISVATQLRKIRSGQIDISDLAEA